MFINVHLLTFVGVVFFLGSVVNSKFVFALCLGSGTKATWLGLGRDQVLA